MLIKKFVRDKKKVSFWSTAILSVTLIQLIGFQKLDEFLQPPDLKKENVAHAQTEIAAASLSDTTPKKISVPKGALRYVFTPEYTAIAYIKQLAPGKKEELIIQDNSGIVLREVEGKVKHMEWLGESDTLLYMLEKGDKQELYLFQLQHKEPHFVYKWPNKEQHKIVKVFFSPYLEYFYLQMKNGKDTELYKYTFSTGLTMLPTENINIAKVTYNDKKDIVFILDQKGEEWEYKNGGLWDKNGRLYADNKIGTNIQKEPIIQKILEEQAAKRVKEETKQK